MSESADKSKYFSLQTAAIVCVGSAILLIFLLKWLQQIDWLVIGLFAAITFVISYVILQFRIEKFVVSKINAVYAELNSAETEANSLKSVTTDMDTLMDQVKEYATKRKFEIDTLKDRDAYRKEFLGNVSHELKTPLFTIQSYILTLLDGAMEKPELCKKYLKRANKGVDRLSYIIHDLDLITKLEVGDLNLEYEAFDIVKLVDNVFELLEMKASKKNIALTYDMKYEPIMVFADKERIRQVLTNLVVNSIKYGNENGTTEVSIQELIGSKMIIRVTDNGEGIKKDHIARLFERFYRVSKSRSREEGGSGLGLSIVKHIVEAHNEHIYVESVYGMGSEFSFTLEKYAPKKSV